jgi:hypothetical protein
MPAAPPRSAHRTAARRPGSGRPRSSGPWAAPGLPRRSVRDRAAQTKLLSVGRALACSAQSHQQCEGGYNRYCESNHEWPERGIKSGHTRAEGPGSGPSVQAGQPCHGTPYTDPIATMRPVRLSSDQRLCAATRLRGIAKPRRSSRTRPIPPGPVTRPPSVRRYRTRGLTSIRSSFRWSLSGLIRCEPDP